MTPGGRARSSGALARNIGRRKPVPAVGDYKPGAEALYWQPHSWQTALELLEHSRSRPEGPQLETLVLALCACEGTTPRKIVSQLLAEVTQRRWELQDASLEAVLQVCRRGGFWKEAKGLLEHTATLAASDCCMLSSVALEAACELCAEGHLWGSHNPIWSELQRRATYIDPGGANLAGFNLPTHFDATRSPQAQEMLPAPGGWQESSLGHSYHWPMHQPWAVSSMLAQESGPADAMPVASSGPEMQGLDGSDQRRNLGEAEAGSGADWEELEAHAYGRAIASCERRLDWERALGLLAEMRGKSIEADASAVNAAFRVCSRSLRVDAAQELLELLRDQERKQSG